MNDTTNTYRKVSKEERQTMLTTTTKKKTTAMTTITTTTPGTTTTTNGAVLTSTTTTATTSAITPAITRMMTHAAAFFATLTVGARSNTAIDPEEKRTTPKPLPRAAKPGWTEKVIDPTRRVVRTGSYYVCGDRWGDDARKTSIYYDGFSRDIGDDVLHTFAKGALALDIMIDNADTRIYEEQNFVAGGQGFLVTTDYVDEQNKGQYYVFCTSKNNKVSETNSKGERNLCRSHYVRATSGDHAKIVLPNTGAWADEEHLADLRNGDVTWASGYGYDGVSLGPDYKAFQQCSSKRSLDAEYLNTVRSQCVPFVRVGSDFKYAVGMKVALVYHCPTDADGKLLLSNSSSRNSGGGTTTTGSSCWWGSNSGCLGWTWTTLLRPSKSNNKDGTIGAGDICILTGEIQGVGERHIAYDVNTCEGCSGAAVFLMDEDHEDYAKVIAVHQGYKEELKKNIGFKLAGVELTAETEQVVRL